MWRTSTAQVPFRTFLRNLDTGNGEFGTFFNPQNTDISVFQEDAQSADNIDLTDPLHIAGLEACNENFGIFSDDRIDQLLGLA